MSRVKRRKSTAKKISPTSPSPALRDIKKEIRQAVNDIPAMLAREVKSEESDTKEENSAKGGPALGGNYVHVYNTPTSGTKSKKFLLWFGVGTVTSLIFIMWIWNVRTIFLDVKPWQSEEASIWQRAKVDLTGILQTNKLEDGLKKIGEQDRVREMAAAEKARTTEEQTKTANQEKIKESLKLILTASASASSTSASSTTSSRP